jgi:hypothetical protein
MGIIAVRRAPQLSAGTYSLLGLYKQCGHNGTPHHSSEQFSDNTKLGQVVRSQADSNAI